MGSAHLRCCFLFNFRGRETIPMPGIFFIPLTKPFYLKKASDFLWRPLSQRGRTSLCLWLRPELCRPRCADAPGTELHRTRAQLPTARSHASPDSRKLPYYCFGREGTLTLYTSSSYYLAFYITRSLCLFLPTRIPLYFILALNKNTDFFITWLQLAGGRKG